MDADRHSTRRLTASNLRAHWSPCATEIDSQVTTPNPSISIAQRDQLERLEKRRVQGTEGSVASSRCSSDEREPKIALNDEPTVSLSPFRVGSSLRVILETPHHSYRHSPPNKNKEKYGGVRGELSSEEKGTYPSVLSTKSHSKCDGWIRFLFHAHCHVHDKNGTQLGPHKKRKTRAQLSTFLL